MWDQIIPAALGLIQKPKQDSINKNRAKAAATLGQQAPEQQNGNTLGMLGGLLGGLLDGKGKAPDMTSRRQQDGSMADPLSYDSVRSLNDIGIDGRDREEDINRSLLGR